MQSKKIIIPVDFTPASDQAISQAIQIARKANLSLLLLHILTKDSLSSQNNGIVGSSDAGKKLKELSARVSEQEEIRCDYKVVFGDLFNEIPATADNADNHIMIIGTHGVQGFKQKLLGADILKIVRKTAIPSLIVQDQCVCRDFNPVVFPVGGHDEFKSLIEATAMMAALFGSVVHIYSIVRKGDTGSEKLRENILLTEKVFKEQSISYKRIKEDSNIFSVGYAKQTLQYAKKIDAGLISIMSVKSDEHYYFAQADKESLINNEFNIPILCVSNLVNNE
jgi:nucleotide-binding universal stress UspA family protein